MFDTTIFKQDFDLLKLTFWKRRKIMINSYTLFTKEAPIYTKKETKIMLSP